MLVTTNDPRRIREAVNKNLFKGGPGVYAMDSQQR